jgi:apolipoprotein N-acyltransferase
VSEPSGVAAALAATSGDVSERVDRACTLAPFAAAAGGGALYFLGYVGYGVWPCLLVFLAPLWWALEGVETRGLFRSLALGMIFGCAAYAGGFLWLWRLVGPFLDGDRLMGAALWIAYGLWFAAGFAVYAALFRALRRRGAPIALAGVAPLLVVEWLQPQIFPLYAGNALVIAPVWAQTADLGGPLLLTALVAGANVVAFETWTWWHGRRPRPHAVWVTAVSVALVTLGYGWLRMAALDDAVRSAPALRVGLVQANLGVLEKDALSVVTHERHLAQTRELLAAGDVDLVIWPETAYVRGLRRPLPIAGRPIRAELSVPLLFGASSVLEVNGRRLKSNSAFLIGADGTIRDVYDKNLLIPLAESLPFADVVPALGRWFPHAEVFAAAHDTPALALGPWRIATPICYEAIRPDFVRRMVERSEPHLLVTLANDAWFGDSREPWIHLALARLRAIEHRRFLVRATNSGVSAIVDPAGRVVAETGVLTRENLRGVVHPLAGRTIYGRLGDWPGWLAAAVVALTLALGASRPLHPRARIRNGTGVGPPARRSDTR